MQKDQEPAEDAEDAPGCAEREFDDLEDGPGDLLDASSSSAPSPVREDMQVALKQEQAIALAQRRERRELATQAVKRRADASLVVNDFNLLVDYFVTTWLETQLRSCWRPIFNALRSDIIDEDPEENEQGPLTQDDLERVVMSGLEIFDEDMIELEVTNHKMAPDWTPPSKEEVDRRVARYMTLDTNGDGVIDVQEFSVRFLSLAREAMLEGADDAFRADYERDPVKLEEEIADKLIAFDHQLQDDVRPLLKLIDAALFPLRTPGERAAAMIERSEYGEVTPYEIFEVARPWDDLEDVGDDGSVNVRTKMEAEVGRMEQEAVRHAIEHERWEASAMFARALTGIEPPPRPNSMRDWPRSGSLDLHPPAEGEKMSAGQEFGDKAGIQGFKSQGVQGGGTIFEEAGAMKDGKVQLPPYWQYWKEDDDDDVMPRHWHREGLVHSRGSYRQDVSCVYLAGLLSNRAQLYRQVTSRRMCPENIVVVSRS